MSKDGAQAGGGAREPIKIRAVRFARTDTPGWITTSSLDVSQPDKKDRYSIEFLPWMRHYRIVNRPAEPNTPPRQILVHESHVSWSEPLD